MILRKKPEASLKLRYDLILRTGLVLSLLLLIGVLVGFPKFKKGETIEKEIHLAMPDAQLT